MKKKESKTFLEKIRSERIDKQLEKIKIDKNLIFVPKITDNMQKSGHNWWTKHKCFIRASNWVDDCEITQVPYPTIRIVHNNMASNIYLDCPKCGEVHDATDYDSW